MTPFALLERHRDECTECDLFRLCAVGAALLERASNMAAERLCPPLGPLPSASLVIDLPGHIAACRDCNGTRLCAVGQQIADERGTVFLDYGVVCKPGQRPC